MSAPQASGQSRPSGPRRVRKRRVVLGIAAFLALLVFLDDRFHYDVWPTPTPFPASYRGVGEENAASVDFFADGTVRGSNLPVWDGDNCLRDPPHVSGVGRWFQGSTGDFWMEIDGQRLQWGPDTQFWSLNWEKVVFAHCTDYGIETATVLY